MDLALAEAVDAAERNRIREQGNLAAALTPATPVAGPAVPVDLALAEAVDAAERNRIQYEGVLAAITDKIAEEHFISGGYKAVETFLTGKDVTLADAARIAKEAAEGRIITQDAQLLVKETERENVESQISILQKQVNELAEQLNEAKLASQDTTTTTTTTLTNSFRIAADQKYAYDTRLPMLQDEISALKLNLTTDVLKAGGQTLLADRARNKILNSDLEATLQEVVEEIKHGEFVGKRKSAESEQDTIDEKLALYTITIDDLASKTAKVERVDKGVKSSTVLHTDKDRIELVSKVAESLFDLNDDNNPAMDLVPELRSAVGIEAKAKSESAELYVAFENADQAAAFCSKMNSFKHSDKKGILNPKAAFVTGFDEHGSPILEDQKKSERNLHTTPNKWYAYTTPPLSDVGNNTNFNGKYVVLIEANSRENSKFTPFFFADEILNSTKADKVISRVKDASLAQRIVENKDETIKTTVALLTGGFGITPAVVGLAATTMDALVTTPLRWMGIPGSSVASTVNQGMYDFAAFGMKRGNLVSYFAPETARKYSVGFEDSSKKLQEKEEINAAQGLWSWKGPNNVVNAFIIRPVTFVPSVVLKGVSFITHGVGDLLLNLSKNLSSYAGKKWSEGGISNIVPCGGLLLTSAVTGIVGGVCRTLGIGTGAVGEVFSKPSKAVHPEGSVKETRTNLGARMGNVVRSMDRLLGGGRKAQFTPEETSKLEIDLKSLIVGSSVKLTSEQIKAEKAASDKTDFDNFIKKVALDIKNPKFNQSSGIKGEKSEYMEIARVTYNDKNYKVSLGINGGVAIAQVGATNAHTTSSFPSSIKSGQVSGFITAVLDSVAAARTSEAQPSSMFTFRTASPLTLRDFGMKFGGISSSTSPASPASSAGDVLKGYLGKTYVVSTVRNVGEYSVKVDGENNIHIGKIGQELEQIEEGKAAKNFPLFEVVSSLATNQKGNQDKQEDSKTPSSSLKNSAERRLQVSDSSGKSVASGSGKSLSSAERRNQLRNNSNAAGGSRL